jgi:flagellar hook-length control protein FliK
MTANAPTSVGQQDTSDQHGQSADKDHLKNGKAPFHATDAAPDGAVSSAVVVASQPWVTVVQPPVQAAVARQSAAASAQQTAAEDAATGGTSANANTSVARAAAQSAPGTSLRGKSSGAAASAVKGDGSHPSTQQSDSSAAKDSAPPVTDALLAQASIVPAPIAAPTPQITAISAQPVVSSSATIQHASIAPEAAFVASNHPPIVMGIHGQLMPDGGNMSIRLAPPELGDLQINVQVSSGSVAASFQTSNDQATRLLSHSLGQLKTSLEAAGVNVERLQVSQMPRESAKQETNSNNNGNQSQQEKTQADSEAGARDQQRREMLRRMWQKVSGKDDIDLVA